MSLSGGMDSEIYGDSRNRFRGYDTSIAAGDEAENEVSIITMHFIRFINDFFFKFQDDEYEASNGTVSSKSISAPQKFLNDMVDKVCYCKI